MSVVDGGSSSGLVQRVQDILMKPRPTWDVIDGEPATVNGLYTKYAVILALLPAIGGLLGNLLLAPLMGAFAPYSMVGSIVAAALSYVLGLVGLYVFALVIDALAPSFDGTKSTIQALKGVVYGSTASWVGGALVFIPIIGWLFALAGGIYSLYLLFLGLPKMMKVPQEKAVGFVIVCLVVAIVIFFVIGMIVSSIVAMAGMASLGAAGLGAAAYR